jgi:putative acetyltransferase
MTPLTFRPFQAGDEAAFRELNEAWIRQFFAIEPKDLEVLGNPVEHILRPGGEIVMAILDDNPIGCCALLAMADSSFELGKMAVAEEHRGRGVGKELLAAVVNRARQIGSEKGSTSKPARSCRMRSTCTSGRVFTHLPPERVRQSPYARSNVYMETVFCKPLPRRSSPTPPGKTSS